MAGHWCFFRYNLKAKVVYPREELRAWFYDKFKPVERFLISARLNPNMISLLGLIFCSITGLLYGKGLFWLGGFSLALAGLCDAFDGTVARNQGKASKRGAFLDSTLDRIGEIFVFAGLIYYFGKESEDWFLLILTLGLGGSFMVSYTKARAEGLGISCKVGLLQRPERFLLMIGGSLLSWIPYVGIYLFQLVFIVISLLAAFTTFERMRFILKSEELGGER